MLQPKSPAAKLNSCGAKSSPISAPAGRSPRREKQSGILSSRRRTAGPFTRIDPPTVFGLGTSTPASSTPFSLDAALKGTIPSYTSRSAAPCSAAPSDFGGLHEEEAKSSWFFDIHEDTPEQEATNLLQHSTCVLDISSDEETETRRQKDRAEGKENVPPVDNVSQTRRPRAARLPAEEDDMVVEKERNPLGEMNVKDYYAAGCDEASVVVVPGDEEQTARPSTFEFAPKLSSPSPPVPGAVAADGTRTVEELMCKTEDPAPSAAVLQPMDGTGESFEVWESGSAKDEGETPAAQC